MVKTSEQQTPKLTHNTNSIVSLYDLCVLHDYDLNVKLLHALSFSLSLTLKFYDTAVLPTYKKHDVEIQRQYVHR